MMIFAIERKNRSLKISKIYQLIILYCREIQKLGKDIAVLQVIKSKKLLKALFS